LKTLPAGILFFIFHLRTKAYFFTQGLLIGKGGYAGTGRGFGLERSSFVGMYKAYSESHYHEALQILAVLIIYASYSTDPVGSYFVRTVTIYLIVISWLWAPILFNPAPTTQDLQSDAKELLDWLTNDKRQGAPLDRMTDKLKKVHFLRLIGLVDNLEKECRTQITMDEAQREPDFHAESATLSNFGQFGITDRMKKDAAALNSVDGANVTQALKIVHGILIQSREKIKRQIERIPNTDDAKTSDTLDSVIREHWGNAENESWEGWYQKAVAMMAWESEDQFFPGLVNLLAQKVYISIETFLPWMILSVDQFKLDSVWFMVLIVVAVVIDKVIDHGFQDKHEYSTLAKGTLIFTVPMAILYFQNSIMTFGQLLWSLLLYFMCIFLAIRATFGVVNARAKFKLFGVYGNPHHTAFDALEAKTDSEKERIQVSVRNRTQEMEATNANEEKRFQLFKARMAHIDYITLLRGWAPLLTSAFLILGNALTVVFGEWITTLNFNGRVNEAWKKAYLRPQTSSGGVDDKSQSFVSVTREPLTHAREQQQNEVLSAQAAVYGTISSSLMP
jgi:hypothetical protein